MNPVMTEVTVQNNSESNNNEISQKELEDREEKIEKSKKAFTFSLYGLLNIGFLNKDAKPHSEMFSDPSFFGIFSLLLILIFSVAMIFFSFLKKILLIKILAILNLLLLIVSVFLFYFSGIIENFSQIKIGFYLILLNTGLIIVLADKNEKSFRILH